MALLGTCRNFRFYFLHFLKLSTKVLNVGKVYDKKDDFCTFWFESLVKNLQT